MAENNSIINNFIDKSSFNSLASCAIIVGIMTQVVKPIISLNPLLMAFIFSIIVSAARLVILNDYGKETIVLALINVFPMALTAAGGYDLITSAT